MLRRASYPTVVLHAGELARAVVRRLTRGPSARAESHRGAGTAEDDDRPHPLARFNLALHDLDAASGAISDGDGDRDDRRARSPEQSGRDAPPRSSHELLRQRIDELLSLPALIASGGRGSAQPRLGVFLLGDLTEPQVPQALRRGLEILLELVRGRYAPLFRSYLDDTREGFCCNPILIVPAAGDPWPPGARELLEHLEALHAADVAPAPVSNIFVLGESSARYLLGRSELVDAVATFFELAAFGALSRDEVLTRQLWRRGRHPYATFVCATAEFDETAALRYCALESVAALMAFLRRTSAQRTEIAERGPEVAELFDTARYHQLVPLEKGDRALAEVIDSQCPSFAVAFRDVGLLEDSEEILEHYGEAWRSAQRGRLDAAQRELGLFRIEEVIDEVEVNGVALATEERRRVDRFVDGKLADTSEGNVADAALVLGHLRKRLAAEREKLTLRATAPLPPPPDLERFDRAYEEGLRAAVAAKPGRARLLLWSLAGWGVATACSALLLRQLVELIGLQPGSLLRSALLPPWAWLTAAVLSGLVLGLLAVARLVRTTRAIRRFVGHRGRRGTLAEILEDLSSGPGRSLAAYYGVRFRRACDIWAYRTLLSVLKHVDDRLARLAEIMATLEEQEQGCRSCQLQLGIGPRRAGVDHGQSDATRARPAVAHVETSGSQPRGRAAGHQLDDHASDRGPRGATFRRQLVDPGELERLAVQRRSPREVSELAQAFCREARPFQGWAGRLPFTELEQAVSVCSGFYRDLTARSVLLQPDLQDEARQRLLRFLSDFGNRLDFHLDFAGQLFRDEDDVERSLAEVVVAGDEVRALVAEAIEQAGAGRFSLLTTDERPGNRVRLLKLVTDLARSAIRWHEAPANAVAASPSTGASGTGASGAGDGEP